MSAHLHITIGACDFGSGLSLESDLHLVKAALLYSDEVRLCSPLSSLIITMLAIGSLTDSDRIDFLVSLMPVLEKDPESAQSLIRMLASLKSLSRKKRRPRDEFLLYMKFKRMLDQTWDDLSAKIGDIAKTAGAYGIVEAIDSGVLDIHVFQNMEDTDGIVLEFFDLVKGAILDGSTFPLFDWRTNALVRAALQEGKIEAGRSSVSRAKHVALASSLLQRLPLFESASIKQVLGIRSELDKPLTRFRSAMIHFSEHIRNASWDLDFEKDAEIILLREVEPAILEIEEAIRSNQYIKKLARILVDKPLVLPSTSVFGILLSKLSDLPDVVAMGLGVTISVGIAGYDAYHEWKKNNKLVEQNQLYFYYRAGEFLEQIVHQD